MTAGFILKKGERKKTATIAYAGSKDFQPEANAYQMEHVLDLLKCASDASYDFFSMKSSQEFLFI